MKIDAAILTISTRGSRSERAEDTSGETIREMVQNIGGRVVAYEIIPDDRQLIIERLQHLIARSDVHLILTTGGTGLSPTDVTPEATEEVIKKRLPGFEEVMRATGVKSTPHALLSRAVAGVAGNTLIINLPGSPKGVRENLAAILDAIPHGIKVLRGGQMRDEEHEF